MVSWSPTTQSISFCPISQLVNQSRQDQSAHLKQPACHLVVFCQPTANQNQSEVTTFKSVSWQDIVSQPDSVILPQSPSQPVSQSAMGSSGSLVDLRQCTAIKAARQSFSMTRAGSQYTQPDQSFRHSQFLSVEQSVTVTGSHSL